MIETINSQPLLAPVTVNIPAGTTRIISFPDEFLGICRSILISNLDAVNIATYRIGGSAQQILSLTTGGFRTIDGTKIKIIEITAGAAGATQVEAQVEIFKGFS
jgi:hypothetical protein